ncbi:inner membrane protein CreD [Yersinia enterocolitica]|nr:inner membrane protein CreD [Yersinia enterocolitica]
MILTRQLDWYQVASAQRLTGTQSRETTVPETAGEEMSIDPIPAGGGSQDKFRLWK